MSEKKEKSIVSRAGDEEIAILQELGAFLSNPTQREMLQIRLLEEIRENDKAFQAIFILKTFFTEVLAIKDRDALVVRNDAHRFADADSNCPRSV